MERKVPPGGHHKASDGSVQLYLFKIPFSKCWIQLKKKTKHTQYLASCYQDIAAFSTRSQRTWLTGESTSGRTFIFKFLWSLSIAALSCCYGYPQVHVQRAQTGQETEGNAECGEYLCVWTERSSESYDFLFFRESSSLFLFKLSIIKGKFFLKLISGGNHSSPLENIFVYWNEWNGVT